MSTGGLHRQGSLPGLQQSREFFPMILLVEVFSLHAPDVGDEVDFARVSNNFLVVPSTNLPPVSVQVGEHRFLDKGSEMLRELGNSLRGARGREEIPEIMEATDRVDRCSGPRLYFDRKPNLHVGSGVVPRRQAKIECSHATNLSIKHNESTSETTERTYE